MPANNPRYADASSTLYWISVGAFIISFGAALLGYDVVWGLTLGLGISTFFGGVYLARRA